MSPKNEPALGLNEDQILELARNPEALREAAARIIEQRRAEVEKRTKEDRAAAKQRSLTAGLEGIALARATRSRYSTGVRWFDELDDTGQMKAIAAANLEAYGTIVPPQFAKLAVLANTCAKCHKTKPVLSGFGIRHYKDIPRSQSQCKQCRIEADTHERNSRANEQ